jgi:pseudaminic acid cytidylyltransferase
MIIAVIPARGGSKRVPRKNVRSFAGRPMIGWVISAAQECDLFDRIIVSTDDDEVRKVAVAEGAEAPFVRPRELSDDKTPTRPVVQHAIREISRIAAAPSIVCCIYATAAFVEPEDLRRGLEVLKSGPWDYSFAVTTFDSPIQRALRMTAGGGVEMINPEFRHSRSQDLEETFHDAGQFYWGPASSFLGDLPVFTSASAPVRIPRHRVHDIDTEEDWVLAELMFEALRRGGT